MKTKTQVLARRRASARLLARAEEAYTEAVGTADEARWLRRCRQLENEIGILDWVLDQDKKPKPIKKKRATPPERQRLIDEYGAECNPKIHGE